VIARLKMPRRLFVVMNQLDGMRWPSSFNKGIFTGARAISLALRAVETLKFSNLRFNIIYI
jgi:hypothetical protein